MTLPRPAFAALALALLVAALPPVAAHGQQAATPAPPPEPSSAPSGQEKGSPPADSAAPAAQQPTAPPPSATAPAGQPAPPPAAPPPPRITFQLPFQGKDGAGGTASGSASTLDFQRDDYAVLTGSVEIHYQDLDLKADRLAVDLATKVVTAEGNVILDQGPRRLAGQTLTFDLGTKTGTLTEATAHVAPDYYFAGAEIAKVGDDSYTVTDGTFTSCEGDKPAWSFHLGRAKVDVDGYARVHNASMRIKKVPIFYTPYLLWPAKSDRTSGLLVPNLGYSNLRGSYVGLAYYQVLGRSVDTTLFADSYGKGFVGVGDELRYRPTEGTTGEFRGYAIREQDLGDWRWKLELDHTTNDLPLGMRGVLTLRRYSDFNFFRDFERSIDRVGVRYVESRGFIAGNWGPHQVNLQATERETFINDLTTTDRRLPELDYSLRSTQLGKTPLVLKFDSSLAYLSVDRSATYRSDYGRIDLQPQLSLPFRPAPWLSFALSAGERFTWYEDSLDASGQSFTGESLTRTVPTGGLEIVGPSFSRVFGSEKGARYKHIIEPRIAYTYQGTFDDNALIPPFDQVDRLGSNNFARFSLINRVKAKPPEEKGGSAVDVFSFELARAYSFDDTQPLEVSSDGRTSQAGPLDAILRFAPGRKIDLQATSSYSVLFNQLTSASLASLFKLPRASFDLRWNVRFAKETGETLSDQVRLGTTINPLPGRLSLQAAIDYDVEMSLLRDQRYVVDFTAKCYGLRFEVRRFDVVDRQATDYRIAFTLKNVGTFLDLTGRYD